MQEYVDTEDPNNLRHCTTVISALPPSSSPGLGGDHGDPCHRDHAKLDTSNAGHGGGGCIDDLQVDDEVTQKTLEHVL